MNRIYKYDNVKAFLIFLVVIGHMTTDYVSDSHMVRWITLWIYTFHMPAFIFISGLVHKHYITEEKASLGIRGETRLRWDKVWGFFFCAYGLKIFLQFTRTLMGQNPLWHWIEEPGIPWYLFVMAEYELLFFVMRKIDDKVKPWVVIMAAFALSAAIGYFPSVGDTFCLSRMINFLPIYAIGYYLDMKKFLPFIQGGKYGGDASGAGGRKTALLLMSWLVIIVSMAVCCFGKWGIYSWRKWFTGRRSYEFLQDYFSFALDCGWWIRIAVWLVALAITLAVITVIPDRNLGYVTTVGARTLQVYFWHRPLCYLFRNWMVLPRLVILFGGTYNEGAAKGMTFGSNTASVAAAFAAYCIIGALMTAFFSLKIFEHPTKELMALGAKIGGKMPGRSQKTAS
ncbi:MAG: acyltransferase family protein [Mogibacterium sp.]|nr:acyltransferase family protein [Mogibacterium sp.]